MARRLRPGTAFPSPLQPALVLIAGLLAITSLAHAASAVFKSKDAQGNTVYSDQPPRGQPAQPVKLGTGNDYTPEPVTFKTPEPTTQEPAAPAEFSGYKSLAILTPAPDATIHDNEGNVPLTFSLAPALQPGHHVQLLLDGRSTTGASNPSGVGTLTNIARGTHEIRLEVRDAGSKVVIQSNAVRFHMLRTSVLLGPTAQRNNGPARRAAGATNAAQQPRAAPHAAAP